MRKTTMTIKSKYGTSSCLGEWEDTHFEFHFYAPYWLVRVCKKYIRKFMDRKELIP